MLNLQQILKKYENIIKEEVNVKDIKIFPDTLNIKKQYIPIGKNISSKFGKDTGLIIKLAKQGQVEELKDRKIKVFETSDQYWILEKEDYEIRYGGDIDDKSMAIEEGIVVGLDLNITPDLKKEGIVRELSRFVNQLRKEVNYNIDDRIDFFWYSEDKDFFKNIFVEHGDYLKQEALLKNIKYSSHLDNCDIKKEFVIENYRIFICLKK